MSDDAHRAKLSRLRRRIGARMTESLSISPHVTMSVDIDYVQIAALRSRYGTAWKGEHGFTLTYLPFVARAVCNALTRFGDLNASVDGDEFVRYPDVNLGVAVDLHGEGLVVPVVRGAHAMTTSEFAVAAHDMAARAVGKQLQPGDVQGGTFTLTSPGAAGADRSTPIINQPQVGILSIDAIRDRVVSAPGAPSADHTLSERTAVEQIDSTKVIAVRPVGALSLSFDHRALDGVYAAAFLRDVQRLIEADPVSESTLWKSDLTSDHLELD